MPTITELLPEESVTFQIALAGQNGLVIASDRLVNRRIDNLNENPTLEMGKQEKFVRSEDSTLVCFFAGGPTCHQIASEIAANCVNSHMKNLDWQMALRKQIIDIPFLDGVGIADQIIVVRRHIPTSFWLVQRVPGVQTAQRTRGAMMYIDEYQNQTLCTGNNVHAKFLSRNLYRSNLTIEQLKKLAMLTLAYAAKENPGSIGGPFDLMTLDTRQNMEWAQYESADSIVDDFEGRLQRSFIEFCQT